MSDQPGTSRLDPETVAAYVDGRLSADERARVEAEVARDPDAYEWLVQTMRVVDALPPTVPGVRETSDVDWSATAATVPMARSFTRRRVIAGSLAGALAVAAAVAMAVRAQPAWWQRLTGAPAVDSRLAALVDAVGEERYIEGRLTGGFKYGRLQQVARGPGDLSSRNLRLLAAAGNLQRAAAKDPTADNLHVWGVAQVLLGDADGAVASLERAVSAGDANDARLLCDLSAAYAARARSRGFAEDWPRALAMSERAVKLRPDLREAAYNVAVSLEGLGLLAAAADAWRAAADAEGQSSWAADARRHELAIRDRLNKGSALPSRQSGSRRRPAGLAPPAGG